MMKNNTPAPPEEQEDAYRRALELAAKQLAYRPLSSAALREKLMEKGCEEQSADYAVAWLGARGLLDDAAYAASLVRSYAARGYGQNRIRQEMQRKKVSREDADNALAEFSPEQDTLVKLLDKRLRGNLSDRREIDKAVAALQRRGFRWNEIAEALRVYGAQQDE